MIQTKNLNQLWANNLSGFSNMFLSPLIPDILQYLKINQCSGSLLDIGCGIGEKSNIFQQMGFDVTGIDYSPKRISEAQSKYPKINFQHYKIESTLPFKDNSFNIIFSCSVFQYIEHEPILKECKRVLKKDGHIILIENLKNNPVTRLGRTYLKVKKFNYQSYPWNHFTLKGIKALNKNFTSPKISTFHFLTPIAYLSPFKNSFDFLHKLDSHLLNSEFLNNYAWLVLFMGGNKKC